MSHIRGLKLFLIATLTIAGCAEPVEQAQGPAPEAPATQSAPAPTQPQAQTAPQGQPQTVPQGQPQYAPQGQPGQPQPQYQPQGQPQYQPQGQPQYLPKDAPPQQPRPTTQNSGTQNAAAPSQATATPAKPASTMPEDVYMPPDVKVNYDFPTVGFKKSVKCVFIGKDKSDAEMRALFQKQMPELGWKVVNIIDSPQDKSWLCDFKKDTRTCRVSMARYARIPGLTVTIVADPMLQPGETPPSPVPKDVYLLPDVKVKDDYPLGPGPQVTCSLVSDKPLDELKAIYQKQMTDLGWKQSRQFDDARTKNWVLELTKSRRNCRIEIGKQARGDDFEIKIIVDSR
jgi:hypothetical protein